MKPSTSAIRPRRLLVLALFAWLVGPFAIPAVAEPSGAELLQRFYQEVQTLHARFQQRVVGPEGRVQERSSGKVWIRRPDRFRWEYKKPYPQTIVADGRTVKFYDPEMEQVTVRPYSAGMGYTPSMVMAGGGDLDRHFRLEDGGDGGELTWVKLVPKDPEEAGFREAKAGFETDPLRLRRFHFSDAFGNHTQISFLDIRLNPTVDPARFRFEAPPGTEVLGRWGRSR